ncbi:MAG: zinc ribbon domain-containing protein [Candidatus Anstonellaceae archaeon]
MGLLELIKNMLKPKSPLASQKAKCPKCSTQLELGAERCPSCGTHVESMFAISCPKCKEQNPLRAEKCSKCGFSFVQQQVGTGKVIYICPICGYRADYFMLSCPSCGVKFVS